MQYRRQDNTTINPPILYYHCSLVDTPPLSVTRGWKRHKCASTRHIPILLQKTFNDFIWANERLSHCCIGLGIFTSYTRRGNSYLFKYWNYTNTRWKYSITKEIASAPYMNTHLWQTWRCNNNVVTWKIITSKLSEAVLKRFSTIKKKYQKLT